MPLIRTESSQHSVNQESRILLALSDLKNSRIKSLRTAATLYELPRSTLTNHARGIVSRVDSRLTGYKLTGLEEESLIK
jgi:hypothetical protein